MRAKREAKLRDLAARLSARVDGARTAQASGNSIEAAFRAFADTVPAIIWKASPEGEVTFFSERFYTLTGAKRTGWRGLIHPHDQERSREAWLAAVAAVTPYANKMRIRIADGSYQTLITRARPVMADDGSVAYWVGSSTCTCPLVLPMLRLVA